MKDSAPPGEEKISAFFALGEREKWQLLRRKADRGWRVVVTATRLLFVCLLAAAPLMALDPQTRITDFVHTKWSAGETPFSWVNELAQTKDGALWLATGEGLFRFDGVRFQRVEALSRTNIDTMLATRDGSLWVVFYTGRVSRLFKGNVTTFSLQELPRTNALAEDRDGSLVAATANGGLARFRNGRWQEAARALHLSAKRSRSVWFDRDGVLWLVTEDRLLKLRPGDDHFMYAGVPGRPKRRMDFLVQSPSGAIWVSNADSVRSLSSGGSEIDISAEVNKVLVDREGALWIGTFGSGLWRIHAPAAISGLKITVPGPQAERFTTKDGLSDDHIYSMIEDREGNLWVATVGGLDRLRNGIFHRVAVPHPDRMDLMWDSPNDGGILIHTSDPPTLEHFALEGKISTLALPRASSAYCYEADGTVWVATPLGIGKWTGKEIVYSVHLRNASFRRIGCGNGDLWFAIPEQGVMRFSSGKVTRIAGLRPEGLSGFYPRGPGLVWITYNDGRISVYDNGFIKEYGTKDGLPEGNTPDIAWDNRGDVWLARNGGLARFRNGHFQLVSVGPGLQDAVKLTENGFLWLKAGRVLIRMAISEFDRAAANPKYEPHLERLSALDGIPGFVLNIAGSRDRLWVLTSEGLGYLDQNSHRYPNTLPPPVEIETMIADGKSVNASQGLTLPKLTHNLEIDYTAFSLTIPERVRFLYKLEGVDQRWQEAIRRQAYYTDLAPRKYRFLVKASNNDGVWNEQGAAVEFSIDPAYYQTHWFQALYIGAALFSFWVLYRFRLRQIRRQFNIRLEERIGERTRIARELHDTLLQSFQGSLFEFQAAQKLLSRRPDEASGMLNNAISSARAAIAEGRNAIHELRSTSTPGGDLAEMLGGTGQEFSEAQSGSPHGTEFRVTVEGSPRALSPVLQDELYRIGREVLRNAFRHARAKLIEVEIRYSAQELRLRIRDDGIGVDSKVLESGARPGHWGLPGVRERAKAIGAKFDLWSQAMAGAEVQITVPAPLAYLKPRTPRVFRLLQRKTGSYADSYGDSNPDR